YAALDWPRASPKSRTGVSLPRNTENRLPASCRRNGTPAAASAPAASLATAAATSSTRLYTSGVQAPRVASPAAGARGLPGRVPGWDARPGGPQPVHAPRPPAEGRGGEPAAHHLAERHQVAGHALPAVPAGPGHPEAGQPLVHDQQRAVFVAERG